MKKPRVIRPEPLDPDVAALNETMSQLARKLAGPDASLADFEMILGALQQEVMAQVRASFARATEPLVEAVTPPRSTPKAARQRR